MKDFLNKYSDQLVMLAIISFSFFWKLPYLGGRDLCLDEPFTLYHSQKSVMAIIDRCSEGPNAPLFMILVHFWSKLVGFSEESIRVLPLIISSLTAGFLYITGKRFFSFWAGLLAAGLFMFSKYFFYFSGELRMYGLMCLCTSGALFFFLKCVEEGKGKDFLFLLLCNVALVYSHYFGWFIIMIEAISALFYLKDKVVFKRLLWMFIGTALSFLPLFLVLIEQFVKSTDGTWLEPPPAGQFKIQVHAFLNSGMVFRLMEFFVPIGLGLAFVLGQLFKTPKKYIVVLIWWLIPLGLMYQLSSEIPMFIDRYVLYCSIGLYVFIGAFIQRFAHFKWLQALATLLLIVHMIDSFSMEKEYCRREIKAAVEEVKTLDNEGNIVILYPVWSKLNFSYHYDLEIFKEQDQLTEKLNEAEVFPFYTADQVKIKASEMRKNEIILFNNAGPYDAGYVEMVKGLKSEYREISKKEFPDNLIVSVFRKN
ncbi:MAG: glycosyltransferase family 39 protein [Flavobacteriales bacterium]